MNRQQLEHAILEVGRRTGEEYFYIIGSAAVLATIPDATDEDLIGTRDIDVLPAPVDDSKVESIADQLDWVLGEGSDFELEYGYHIQGVSSNTPTYAPGGWRSRTIPVKVEIYTGLCMEIHDLALSKYGAGREKDLLFTNALALSGLVDINILMERLSGIDANKKIIDLIRARVKASFNT